MRYTVRLTTAARTDLKDIYSYIAAKASPAIARGYVGRITTFIGKLDTFPERGTFRDDVREGLRIIGFERRINIAFVIDGQDVVILRILYAGRQFGD